MKLPSKYRIKRFFRELKFKIKYYLDLKHHAKMHYCTFMEWYHDECNQQVSMCACCQDTECCEVFSGDEGWTICPGCGAVEQGYDEMSERRAEMLGII